MKKHDPCEKDELRMRLNTEEKLTFFSRLVLEGFMEDENLFMSLVDIKDITGLDPESIRKHLFALSAAGYITMLPLASTESFQMRLNQVIPAIPYFSY